MNKTAAKKICEVMGTVCRNIDEEEMDGGSFLRKRAELGAFQV